MSRTDGARQGLAAGASAATVLLTGAAFWLSYEHLHDVSAGNGLTGARAWAWPATIDLFIVVGELLLLRASLGGSGVDWWAVALTVTGSGSSIALNVAGVGSGAPKLTYVVAAVPPVAALLAFGALMRQVHDRLAVEPEPMDDHFRAAAELTDRRDVGLPEPAAVPAEPAPEPVVIERVPEPQVTGSTVVADLPQPLALGPWMPVAELLAGTGRDQGRFAPEPSNLLYDIQEVPAEPEAEVPEPETGTAEVPPGVAVEHVEAARQWLEAEPELTGTAIGTRLGKSDGYGRRVRRAAVAVTV